MADLKLYWQEVRALASSLPQFVWLMSLADASRGMVGGRWPKRAVRRRPKLLHAKSHRMATEDEIAAHLASEEKKRSETHHEGLRRRGIAVVALPVKPTPAADGKRAATKRR